MREMFVNGRRMRLMQIVEGCAGLLDAQLVGVFPNELMAVEAVVQTIEQRHATTVPPRAA